MLTCYLYSWPDNEAEWLKITEQHSVKKSPGVFVITAELQQSDRSNTQRHKLDLSDKICHKMGDGFVESVSALDETFQTPVPSSRQHSAALFAIIKLHHKSQVSPCRGWSSASFTDIRVCLCGWVMDYSAGMLFCGDYKGPYSDWEASTKLSHNSYFVSQRLSWEGSWHSKHPCFPTAPHTPPTVNLPIPLDPLVSLQNQTKRPGSKHEGFTEGSGICISHSCS